MTWEELQNYLKGKLFLVGLTFVDENGILKEQYQTHGIVQELTNDGLIKLIREDKTIFQMPYDNETINEAEKGEYREKSTGQIINNPDYIMTWEISITENDNINEIKEVGFMPFN